ncbi:putative glucosidase, partial [Yersinia pestis PY-100]
MKTLKNWLLINEYPDHLELRVDDRHIFCLYVLEPNLCRVLIKREGELALSRTWSIAPQGDVPWSGRDRLSLEGFSLPGYQLEKHEQQLVVTTECLRVTIHQPLHLTWEYKNPHGEWLPLAADRPTSAYL